MDENWLVETVDADGRPCGAAPVEQVHRAPGVLHRAVSVVIVDDRGHLLLQRRSASKPTFASRWDVACSGHPLPGQAPSKAAAVRVYEELGLTAVVAEPVGCLRHRMRDPAGGRVEYVFHHLYLAALGRPVQVAVDPLEVDEVRWVVAADALPLAAGRPRAFTPWFIKAVTATFAAAVLLG
ncbi:isopentenyl-diphosphate Delta-isomerase [Catellatospora sp. NPDC049609]|uniref:isopentenyl-diphosphate Delta-isomerase n=1 Tax=Catellatospora sp. NPDC049609 TaxID=3155505 RepID=UPI00343B228C